MYNIIRFFYCLDMPRSLLPWKKILVFLILLHPNFINHRGFMNPYYCWFLLKKQLINKIYIINANLGDSIELVWDFWTKYSSQLEFFGLRTRKGLNFRVKEPDCLRFLGKDPNQFEFFRVKDLNFLRFFGQGPKPIWNFQVTTFFRLRTRLKIFG